MRASARVLIVDDEDHIRLLYRTELESAGFEVDELASGRSLLERLASGEPDVLILDIKMPGPSGLDLLGEVRARHPRLAVVLCSAFSSFQGDMRTLPADAYILKSSDLVPLVEAVRRLVEERVPEPRADEA